MQILTILGTIPTKKNKYAIKKGGGGLYKPLPIIDFENMVGKEISVQRLKRIEGPMSFSLLLIYDAKKQPDLDGAITSLLDAMQLGGLFDNDRDVVHMRECEKRISTSKEDPARAIIEIGEYEK